MKKLYSYENNQIDKSEILKVGDVMDENTPMDTFFDDPMYFMSSQLGYICQLKEIVDTINWKAIYDTITKKDDYSPWIYRGQCYSGEVINRTPELAPIVYVCSRYRSDILEELDFNVDVAETACRMIVNKGEIPVAPHLYFPRFMDDDVIEEREFAMAAGRRLMRQCDKFYVIIIDDEISTGMESEIDFMTNRLGMRGEVISMTREQAEEAIKRRLE